MNIDDIDILPLHPEPHENQYRVKLRDGSWSDWRSLDVPLTEADILAIETVKMMTQVQLDELLKRPT